MTAALAVWMTLASALALDPNPSMDPAQVVKTVAEALGSADSPVPNAGIFIAYRFSSPAIHRIMGPYGRFMQVAKHPDFAPLLATHPREYGPVRVAGEAADQVVNVRMPDGRSVAFRFSLSRQKDGFCRGCWMLDAVQRESGGAR